MTRLLLHAIARHRPPTLDEPLLGVRGQPLVHVATEALAAWATIWTQSPTMFERDDMLAHHELVSSLHARAHAVLPARFPTWLDDELHVRQLLNTREDSLSAALERVQNRVELAVSVVWTVEPTPVPHAATPGTRYLRERQQTHHVRDELEVIVATIERATQGSVVDRQVRVAPHQGLAASIALLVERDQAAQVAEQVVHAVEREDVRILVNGPWPPYTFAVLGPLEA
jgi:Gas vesicle synthesis protein GvpL/GvpF